MHSLLSKRLSLLLILALVCLGISGCGGASGAGDSAEGDQGLSPTTSTILDTESDDGSQDHNWEVVARNRCITEADPEDPADQQACCAVFQDYYMWVVASSNAAPVHIDPQTYFRATANEFLGRAARENPPLTQEMSRYIRTRCSIAVYLDEIPEEAGTPVPL